MIIVGKRWDPMRPEAACCVVAIGAIKGTLSRQHHPDNLVSRCGTCDSVWVWQGRLSDVDIRLAVNKDGSPTSGGNLVLADPAV